MNNPWVLLFLTCIGWPLLCWFPITGLVLLVRGSYKLRSPIVSKELTVQPHRDVAGFGGPRR
jgi:hypothetical protein